MKTFYFSVNQEGIITDAIDYPFEGYIEVELNKTHLPAGINGGWWKLEGGVPVEYLNLKPSSDSNEIITLKQRASAMEQSFAEANLLQQETLELLIDLGVI